jgi:hypothetical protein
VLWRSEQGDTTALQDSARLIQPNCRSLVNAAAPVDGGNPPYQVDGNTLAALSGSGPHRLSRFTPLPVLKPSLISFNDVPDLLEAVMGNVSVLQVLMTLSMTRWQPLTASVVCAWSLFY